MSFTALGWASRIRPDRASDKLLLLALAECHNEEHGLSWPSIAWLAEFTRLDRKTIIAGIKRLAEAGHIIDSGKRVGKTKQIVAWALPSDRKGAVIPDKSPVIPTEQSRKRDTEPIKEPIKNATVAREGLDDDWKPSEKALAQIVTDHPNVDVDEQLKAFILRTQSTKANVRDPDAAFKAWMGRLGSLKLPVKARATVAAGSVDPATAARTLTDHIQFCIRHGRHDDAAKAAVQLVTAHSQAGDDAAARKAVVLAIEQWRAAYQENRAEQLELWALAQWGKDWRKINGQPKDQDDKGSGYAGHLPP